MVWTAVSPVGTVSVRANLANMVGNTTYTKTTMNVDHNWDVGVNEDGHHKYVQMAKRANPAIAAGMDTVTYARVKTVAEAPAQQDVNLYLRNASSIQQLLGIRACVGFQVNQTTHAVTITYNHNVASVVRVDTGKYTITFSANLPSDNYFVLGNGSRYSSNSTFKMNTCVEATTDGSNKTNHICKVLTYGVDGTTLDPFECWFVFFGG